MKEAFVNGYVLNGHKDMIPEKKDILVVDGKITEILDNGYKTPEELSSIGYKIIDIKDKYLMPGLINMHIHIPGSGRPKKGKTDYKKIVYFLRFGLFRLVIKYICASNVKKQLLSGTTTVRAVGGVMDFDTDLRNKINSGKVLGPRLIAANYAVSVPDGHMTGVIAIPVNSPDEARQMVRDLDKTKVDFIKIMITGGVLDAIVPGEPGILKMPPEIVKAACDEAHKLGYYVAAHVESTEGLIVALENGVDTIEHGGKSSPETTKLFKQKGAKLICTLSPAVPFVHLDTDITGFNETDLINARALLANMIDCIKEALKNNIPVGLGTDTGCPFITHYDMWRELVYFTKYIGVSNTFAIYSATLQNAVIAGIDNETGSVDIGKYADFAIVNGDPTKDLTVLKTMDKVVFKGNVIHNPKPKKYDVLEKLLDDHMATL